MNTESPRLRALLAAGAALVVFGITVPATATSGEQGPPPVGTVGSAAEKANPTGQTENDKNKGFTCDENKGAGLAGNPALPHNCGDGYGTPTGDAPTTGEGESNDPGDWSNEGS